MWCSAQLKSASTVAIATQPKASKQKEKQKKPNKKQREDRTGDEQKRTRPDLKKKKKDSESCTAVGKILELEGLASGNKRAPKRAGH